MSRSPETGFCRLKLRADPVAEGELDRILAAHARLLDWLEASVPAGHRADLVALHRSFYEAARAVSGLPARSVTLAFKDWVRRRRGEVIEGLPLDEKLYSLKGIEAVSIATMNGRITLPFRVEDYGRDWIDPAPARLVKRPGGFELMVSTNHAISAANVTPQEKTMSATESALTRIARVIAGMTNLAIDAAEGVSPEAVIGQSIREIDAASEEVRTDLGKAMAERHRLDARRQQLLEEKTQLDGRVRIALDDNRDDLAEAGIARQIDIDAQVGVLDRMLADTDEKIAQLGQTLDAVAASRREAEQTLKDFRASQADKASFDGSSGGHGGGKANGAMSKVARAQAATARVSGVPASPGAADAQALNELAELERRREVKARLERLKSGRSA